VVLGVAFARLPVPGVVAFLLFDSDGEAAVVLAGGAVAPAAASSVVALVVVAVFGDVFVVVSVVFVVAFVVVASVAISVVAVLFGFWIHSVQVTSSSSLPTCTPQIM